ncbi:unnamed protein product [Brachionus calyciflorus]|uniref:PIN domain-containing protein n=1 Tax=Brachionus calyciflorus TaxID=104777 RepID=A0A814CU10_9BILA|nr:unnamed protein product [Brachionus calyciflorus]
MSTEPITLKPLPQVDNKNKLLYQSVVDKSKKLDDIYSHSDAFYRLFQNETTVLRDKLQKYCETLIFREPIEYAKKAEEILWRKGFYEMIRIVKLNKKNLKLNAEIEAKYRLHLTSAYGFYNHLIIRFQSEFRSVLQLDGFLNLPLINYEKNSLPESQHEKKELLREVAIRILHKLLICLGDLTRYQLEYDPATNKKDSKYYLMSLMLLPTNGMPLNQLGTLFSSENYGCDAAYYYFYSLSCTEPFYGARENLKLLFLKNRKRYDEIRSKNYIVRSKLTEYEPDELRNKEIKKFLVLFLYIIDLVLSQANFFNSNSTHIDNIRLQELCQLSLQEFNSCMFYLKKSDPKQPYLQDDLVFKLALLILMCVEQIKTKKQPQIKSQSDIYFTVVAYGLIFFSYIVNHAIIRFEQSLLRTKNKQIIHLSGDEASDKADISQIDQNKSNENKTSKKKTRLLYGQRRRNHYSDSDTNESEEEQNKDSSQFSQSDEEDQSQSESRSRRGRPGPRRRTNVARFIERENLSETELNPYASESSDFSSSSTDESSSESSDKDEPPKSEFQKLDQEKKSETSQAIFTNPVIDNKDFFVDNYLNNQNLSSNFKELSLQLLSDFSSVPANSPSSSSLSYALTNSEDFVDNEIYKFILNGKKQVSVPPGFELNTKEVQEIEELGKKIASFQIETDTEMSVINSDNSEQSDFEVDEIKKMNELENAKLVTEILEDQKLLPAIKVFCDWLLCNKKIIQSISKITTTLWPKIAVLLNILPSEKQIASNLICNNEYVRNLISKSFETKSWNNQPLAEDIHMRSFNALKLEQIYLKFDLNKLNRLSIWDEHLLRLCVLRRFGYLIASLSQSQKNSGGSNFFEYNLKSNSFNAIEIEEAKSKIIANEDASREDRQMKLMKSMAQLRLEAEISQLESTFKNEDFNWSPYLIPDTSVLCDNLKMIQDLSRSNKFLIIVPLVVIDQLDMMKRDSKEAREAIKWLEIQFKNGNRFLRAQNQHESNEKLNPGLKKKDLDLWRFNQIIDCCLFFQQQSTLNNPEPKKPSMVTLLVNDDVKISQTKFKEIVESARQKSIELWLMKDFYEKWRKLEKI